MLKRVVQNSYKRLVLYEDLSPTQYSKFTATIGDALNLNVKLDSPSSIAPGAHFAYFNHAVRERDLGKDGYDMLQAPIRETELAPGEVLVRRWVGGYVQLNSLLNLRNNGVCIEEMHPPLKLPNGRKWEVTVDRFMSNDIHPPSVVNSNTCSVFEQRKFLYFATTARALKVLAKQRFQAEPISNAEFKHTLKLTPTLIFRFSALTFNAHLIHYNHTYAQEVEQLPEILAQGPLLVSLMMRWLNECLNPHLRLKTIEYRNLAPVYLNANITLLFNPATNCAQIASDGKLVFDSEVEVVKDGTP